MSWLVICILVLIGSGLAADVTLQNHVATSDSSDGAVKKIVVPEETTISLPYLQNEKISVSNQPPKRMRGNATISQNAGTNILDHSMASKVNETTGIVIMRTYNFSVIDSKAYSWLSLGKVKTGMVEWRWYSPGGNQFYTKSVNIPMPIRGDYWRAYNVWACINIAGSNAVNYAGDWFVDVYLNGQKLLTENFSISDSQPPIALGNPSLTSV